MRILVANSSLNKNKPLIRLLDPLVGNFEFSVCSSDRFFASSFSGGTAAFFGPKAGGWGDLSFLPFIILAWPFYFVWLFWKRFKGKVAGILCCDTNEKLLLTFSARILGMKVLWLEAPDKKYHRWSPSTWALILFSNLSSVAGFTSASLKNLLSLGFKKSSLVFVPPAGEWDYARQDDLFSELAVSEKPRFFFKNFSIGTVVDFSDRGHFESLLKALKNCSNIIPNIRLVVIGSGSERRGLNWLSKKLGIESKVWFVGEQEDLVKWFDSFDLFLSLSAKPNLFDLEMVLLAMSRGIPSAVFKHESFDDFIADGDTGLVIASASAEELAKRLIDIEPDKELLKSVGENGKSLVESRLNRRNQSSILASLLE
jgi:glycosyltransferase involved in cell wall biosynthesis